MIALATVLIGSFQTQSCAARPTDRRTEELERPLPERAADLLSRSIRIRTYEGSPDLAAERRLAQLFVDELQRAGLEARRIDTPSHAPADDGRLRAAAWGRLPASEPRGEGGLLLLSHLDVVPAEGPPWLHDPFAGRIVDGYVHGRGALDAKGVAVVHLLALAEIAARGRPLHRDLLFLSTPDEESGGLDGAGHLVRERPELFEGVEYVLTEGGGIQLHPDGSPPTWGVTIGEKSPCWIEVQARGQPGHSSTPRPDAAVPRLIAALERVRRIETPLRVLPEVARMFRELAPSADPEGRAGYADLSRYLADDARFRRRFLANPGRAALVRNTISITVLEGAARTNVAPARARAHLDARLLPGERCEDFQERIAEVIDDPSVELRTLLSFASRSSPVDSPLFEAIATAARQVDPGARVMPRVIGGFTDAHWFRERGLVAYGFVPRWLAPEDTRGVHGPDERVSVANLERGIDTLVRILDALE